MTPATAMLHDTLLIDHLDRIAGQLDRLATTGTPIEATVAATRAVIHTPHLIARAADMTAAAAPPGFDPNRLRVAMDAITWPAWLPDWLTYLPDQPKPGTLVAYEPTASPIVAPDHPIAQAWINDARTTVRTIHQHLVRQPPGPCISIDGWLAPALTRQAVLPGDQSDQVTIISRVETSTGQPITTHLAVTITPHH